MRHLTGNKSQIASHVTVTEMSLAESRLVKYVQGSV